MGTAETYSNITPITLRSFRMKSTFIFTLMVLTLAATQAEVMTVEETQQRFLQFMYHLKDLSNEECIAMLQEFDAMVQPGGEISAENYEDICTFIREELWVNIYNQPENLWFL